MKRLEEIVKYINSDDILMDVGCDHGYLIKLALVNKKIKKAYAVDNKIGPLESAKANLKDYREVNFLLSDGLTSYNETDVTCVVIAGMGGMLINKIFNDSIDKFKNINKIIVAPNKNVDKVRENFTNNGYLINNESIVFEDGIYYEIIEFVKGNEEYSIKELKFGPKLLESKSQDFINKWTNIYNKLKDVKSKEKDIKEIEEVLK